MEGKKEKRKIEKKDIYIYIYTKMRVYIYNNNTTVFMYASTNLFDLFLLYG